jgi:predicted GIY-YIG superfamily endonuclease
MAATKEQERAALASIKNIVDSERAVTSEWHLKGASRLQRTTY